MQDKLVLRRAALSYEAIADSRTSFKTPWIMFSMADLFFA